MEIELEIYKYLPCEAQIFKINGIKADKSDWGAQNPNLRKAVSKYEDVHRYGCEDSQFVPSSDPDVKEALMEHYHLIEEEFVEICDTLVKTFNVGECGWCI